MKIGFNKLARRIRLLNNTRRSFVSIEFQRGLPRLRVLEKYEGAVKWLARIITAIGVATSVVTFEWYVGLAAALALVGFEQILEKAVFLYASMYVQPLPNFRYEPDEWAGMLFAEPDTSHALPIVAPTFHTEAYARKFFAFLRAWNYDEDEDRDNNVQVSFILEDEEKYSVYLYPSLERQTVADFKEAVEEQALRDKPGKEHFQIVLQMMICHMMDYSSDSYFERFRQRWAPGKPFWLAVAVPAGAAAKVLLDAGYILKYECKIKRRSELTREDMEYEHGKMLIGS